MVGNDNVDDGDEDESCSKSEPQFVSVWSKACIKEGIKSSGIQTLLNVAGWKT